MSAYGATADIPAHPLPTLSGPDKHAGGGVGDGTVQTDGPATEHHPIDAAGKYFTGEGRPALPDRIAGAAK